MKKKLLIALALAITFLILSFKFLWVSDLTEKQAFMLIFGNYNNTNKTAIWKNIPIAKENNNAYFSKKIGVVSTVFFQPYHENGKKKFFLLTNTKPIDIPFECHACRPLLSGAVFSQEKSGWAIEAQQLFMGYDGEYGIAPKAKLIQVGRDKFGLILTFKYVSAEMTDEEETLLIPYKKNITTAYQETIYSDNFNRCGRYIQCAAYSTKIYFDTSKETDFYPMKVTKFGTDNDPEQQNRAVPVNEELIYKFREGKYIQTTSE
jgi:hypothetical protein